MVDILTHHSKKSTGVTNIINMALFKKFTYAREPYEWVTMHNTGALALEHLDGRQP